MGELVEGIFQVVCYFTGKIVLQVLSFGGARTEGGQDGAFPWHGVKRIGHQIVLTDDATALLGMIFWFLVAAAAVAIYWNRG